MVGYRIKRTGIHGYLGLRAALLAILVLATGPPANAQTTDEEVVHMRGRIWENLRNDGWLGNLGAWDYLTSNPLGMFPGFNDFTHPVGNEFEAINTFANANMHNFRSGLWIVARNLQIPGTPPGFSPTPTEHYGYLSGLQESTFGVAANRDPLILHRNYSEEDGYDARFPEEWTESTWHTNVGITVTRRSYQWSFPGFNDFIIYDYILKNTGEIVSTLTSEVVPNFPQQTLRDVYIAKHSGISVSTKSQINFHCDLNAVQAGAFGWQKEAYHDYYHLSSDGTLMFSYNYDGGHFPTPWNPYCVKGGQAWRQRFGPELMSPAGFGWLALHASPRGGQAERASPRPDVTRIDLHKGGSFGGRDLDLEFFRPVQNARPLRDFWTFASTPDLQDQFGNAGNRLNFYTLSYGPYTLAPGDSVRVVMAQIAGVMDYHQVIAGDPDGHFPDSTIAAVYRNAENARRAVEWGMGANVNGVPLAAHVPPPPPAPETDAVNASVGTDEAVIAVTWDDVAETTTLTDGAGNVFYNGLNDLDGYRVYRSRDFQFTTETEPPALRGAAWTLLADIPKSEFSDYWDHDLQRYRFEDFSVNFGFQYGYYVAAYRNSTGTWVSANGTAVTDLGPMQSGSVRRTEPADARPGPVSSFDIYAVPNPFVFNQPGRSFGSASYQIEFRNLPEQATIRIYSLAGDLVRTIEHGPDSRGSLSGSAVWRQQSDSGLLVAPGVYLYSVESRTEGVEGVFHGKLMIVR